ncbi:hypothetical protein ACFY41_10505 [Streptomyces syringium]|uniref:hypothetical protein n=1 Tax=Streptomyces syringium TaxID=76729 RepID=UPI00369405B6
MLRWMFGSVPRVLLSSLVLMSVVLALVLMGRAGLGSSRACPRPVSGLLDSDVVGEYVGPDGARITLTASGSGSVGDRSFTADKWPYEKPLVYDREARINGSGHWSVQDYVRGKGTALRLTFDEGPERGHRAGLLRLAVGREGAEVMLYEDIDPGSCPSAVFEPAKS